MFKKVINRNRYFTDIRFKFIGISVYRVLITKKQKTKYFLGIKVVQEFDFHDKGEINFIKKNFKELLSGIPLEKFKKLTANLDEKSVNIVSRVLNRVISCLNEKNITNSSLFFKEEIQEYERANKIRMLETLNFNNEFYFYHGYYLPLNCFETEIFDNGHNIRHIKNPEKFKNKNIIDAGAYVGDSACIFSKYTDKNVYSFEPCGENFKMLEKTIELNDIKNVIPVKKALGSKNEKEKIYYCGASTSILPIKGASEEEIEIITLDEFVEKNNLDIGLIKIDIEGFEQQLLKGAYNTIKTQKPVLIISIYHNYNDFFEIKPLIESLNLGYSFKIVSPIDGNAIVETYLIAEVI